MLWIIIVILLILWLLGAFGRNVSPSFRALAVGSMILIVIVVILVLLKLLGVVTF